MVNMLSWQHDRSGRAPFVSMMQATDLGDRHDCAILWRRDRTGYRYKVDDDQTPTLAEVGLTKKQSAVAQKLADLPTEQFEQVREGASTITKAIREVEHARRRNDPLPDTGTFRVLYIGPPSSYGNSGVINSPTATGAPRGTIRP